MRRIPKVSIGMPVYNGERYICNALDSLLSQTFTDFELIISDNASSDKTQIICQDYSKKDSRIQYIRQTINLGAANNFQFVLNKARGKYFMWASHDDIWERDFILRCIDLLKNEDSAVAAITRSAYNGSTVDSGDSPMDSHFSLIRIAKFLINPGPNSRFYSLYKKNSLETINFSSYDYHAGDWAFVIDMLLIGRYLRDDDYVGFLKRPGGAGSKISKHKSGILYKILFFIPLKDVFYHFFKKNFLISLILFPFFIRLNFINLKYIKNAK
ncbi:MAG: glycosyltransferase family 2 protein [Bacteroidia bacterium]|nr:glycosyltransferase family 2 protein [Bacteroidia bacterium]